MMCLRWKGSCSSCFGCVSLFLACEYDEDSSLGADFQKAPVRNAISSGTQGISNYNGDRGCV